MTIAAIRRKKEGSLFGSFVGAVRDMFASDKDEQDKKKVKHIPKQNPTPSKPNKPVIPKKTVVNKKPIKKMAKIEDHEEELDLYDLVKNSVFGKDDNEVESSSSKKDKTRRPG